MSTLFYAKINERKRKSLIQKINSNLNKDNFEECKIFLDLLNENKTTGIKLGKMSCGWQFAWYHHKGLLFDVNLESIKEFLRDDVESVVDEYGIKYKYESFLNYIEKSLYKNYEHMDFKSYYEKHTNEKVISLSHDEDLIEIRGKLYQAHIGEFKSDDGLRFFVDNNFF